MSGKHRRGIKMVVMAVIIAISVVILVFMVNNYKNEKNTKKTEQTLMVDQTSIHLEKKDAHHLFVILVNSDGTRMNVTRESQFKTTDENIVTVNDTGVISAINNGKAAIIVRYKEFKETIDINVTAEMSSVNVKDYGASGDGMTNDTAAFQNAIDDISKKGGGNVFIPEGTYLLDPLFLKPKTNLIGENREKVTLKYADDAPNGQDRLITMSDHTKIQNITCDGNYKKHSNGTEHMHCIFAYDSDHIVIENNRLVNAVGDGISISGSKKTSDFVTISNNIVEENQRSQIVIEQVNHVRILNNQISSVTGRPGIHFEPWEEMQYYDATITGNTITSNTDGYGVFLTGADPEDGDNGVKGKGYYFHGIEFYNNKVRCPKGFLRIIDTEGVKVYKNTIDAKYIHLWRKNENVNIHSNAISGEVGVLIEGGKEGEFVSTGTKIYGNTFHSLNEGVKILEASGETNIYNNTFTGSGKYSAVKLIASQKINHVTVSENTFNSFQDGVYLDYYSNGTAEIRDMKVLKNKFRDLIGFALNAQGKIHTLIMDHNLVNNSSGVSISVHEDYPIMNSKIINNSISDGKNGIIITKKGQGELKGLTIEGNRISNTTGLGNQNLTGAAIEIDQNAAPANVSIKQNILEGNARNFITVPESLRDSVKNNSFK